MKATQVTISDTEATSETINLRDSNIKLVGLLFPVLSTATTFTLTMSDDGTNFYSILDSSGAAVEFTLLADGACYVSIPEQYTQGIDYFRIVMAGAVNADRVIKPITQRLMYP